MYQKYLELSARYDPKGWYRHAIGASLLCLLLVAIGSGIWALPVCAMVGWAKEEFWDKRMGNGTYDVTDMIATSIPGLIVSLAFVVHYFGA